MTIIPFDAERQFELDQLQMVRPAHYLDRRFGPQPRVEGGLSVVLAILGSTAFVIAVGLGIYHFVAWV